MIGIEATPRELALKVIGKLPENATWKEIRYAIYVKHMIEEGLKDVREGRTVPHSEILKEFGVSVVAYLRCTAGKASHSANGHTRSANPAAIAGVRRCQRPSASFRRSVSTGQQKL